MKPSIAALITSITLLSSTLLSSILLSSETLAAKAKTETEDKDACLVIGHRGASGYVPEHTLAAYTMAVKLGADYIEPDLVATKDHVLIARHDNALNLTTDVASRKEFAGRKKKKKIDGREMEGWFSEDFTLAEIKTLRAIERIPKLRPGNSEFDGFLTVPTFEEILDLIEELNKRLGRRIGIYPETKHPTYFRTLGLPLEEKLVESLAKAGYSRPEDPVYIQSFEVSNLQKLRKMTRLRLAQLLWKSHGPFDQWARGNRVTYDQMATPKGLKDIAKYADAVGPEKYHFIIPKTGDGKLGKPTKFVANAKSAGLEVHPFTFRAENAFLPEGFKSSGSKLDRGRLADEIVAFLRTGINGFFTDHADAGREACRMFLRSR